MLANCLYLHSQFSPFILVFNLVNHPFLGVSYPGKGECADPVNEDAILEKEGGESPGRNKEHQLASDTGGGKT